VPALELDDGELLTEGPAIVQFLADRRPKAGLMPPSGTTERYRVQSMLGYINTELHKSFGPLFSPQTAAEARLEREGYLRKRYVFIERQLDNRNYLFVEHFTAADAYLFTITQWARFVKLDLAGFPNLAAFQERVAQRPAVQAAMRAEGLIP
jgi:glutathione S-transferase